MACRLLAPRQDCPPFSYPFFAARKRHRLVQREGSPLGQSEGSFPTCMLCFKACSAG